MKVLLTNRELCNLGGSELVTVELAEEYMRQGHEVTVYSPRIGGVLDVSHINTTTERPKTDDFDLIWIHHNLLIHDLGFRKKSHQRIVFNHMSSYVDLEWPRLPGYENQIADIILANSEETRACVMKLGLERVHLFQNPAPIGFDSVSAGREYALFISNHRPEELMMRVADIGIPVKFVGANDKPERVTPEMMSGAAFIVANGKSCQYALRAGVPVFLYDHFGGIGWLNHSNFSIAEYFNFSGRGFQKNADPSEVHNWRIQSPMFCGAQFKLEVVLEAYGLI